MTIKVIATDMDGTFLDDKGSYDKERFSQILDAMDARDMQFVVASGTSMSRLKTMFAEMVVRWLAMANFCVRSSWHQMMLKTC